MISFLFLILAALALAVILIGISTGWPDSIYSSWPMTALWSVTALTAVAVMMRRRLWRRPATFLLHVSLLLILVGAAVSHFGSCEGTVHLRGDSAPSGTLKTGDGKVRMPFSLRMDSFQTVSYPSTSTPMDYRASMVAGWPDGREERYEVSVNRAVSVEGFDFTLQSADSDGGGFTLRGVSDGAGKGISFSAYALLLLSMIAFFFQKRSLFRSDIGRLIGKGTLAVLLVLLGTFHADAMKLPDNFIEEFGSLRALHNGRVAPLATVASDFTATLTGGSPSWKGHSSEEVMAGFLFDLQAWKKAPMIRVKSSCLRELLGVEGRYAGYADFMEAVASGRLDLDDKESMMAFRDDIARFEAVNMLLSGELLKIFPVKNGEKVEWYSPADRLPVDMEENVWMFVRKAMGLVNEQVLRRDFSEASATVGAIGRYQDKTLGTVTDGTALALERFYNRWGRGLWLAIGCAVAGVLLFIFSLYGRRRDFRLLAGILNVSAILVLSALIGIRWRIGGHIPLANGFETMQFMGWCLLSAGSVAGFRWNGAGAMTLLAAGLSLAVAAMSGSAASVTPLMPVLTSPLLSMHVVCVMMAYALFLLMALIGIAGLVAYGGNGKTDGRIGEGSSTRIVRLSLVSRVMALPGVFLLAAGIFIGAVWADIGWGVYWNWDPKEVWALITMLVYSLELHPAIVRRLDAPRRLFLFNILAFLSVLVTYFGVNFFLGGLHSYA